MDKDAHGQPPSDLSHSIGRKLLDKWGWENRVGSVPAPQSQGHTRGLGYSRSRTKTHHDHSFPSPSPLAPSPGAISPNPFDDSVPSPPPAASPVERVHYLFDSMVDSARHDMVFGVEYKLPSLQVHLREIMQEIHTILAQREIHPDTDTSPPFVVSRADDRDHLHNLILICEQYLKITKTNSAETALQLKELYQSVWERGRRRAPQSSWSSVKEGTYEAEKGSDSEEESSCEDGESPPWKPEMSLWDVFHCISPMKDAYGSEYESFSLWWLSLSACTPQFLHTLWQVVFVDGSVPLSENTSLDQLHEEISDILSLLSQVLLRWKPLLQSQAIEYLEASGASEEGTSNWKENKHSAYEVCLYRFLTPIWERVFAGLGDCELEFTPHYLVIWNRVCAFSRNHATLFPVSYLRVVNGILVDQLIAQYLHHLDLHSARTLVEKLSAWFPVFVDSGLVSDFVQRLREILWQKVDDCFFFMEPTGEEENTLRQARGLFGHLLLWHDMLEDSHFDTNFSLLLRYLMRPENRLMSPFPTPVFYLLNEIVQKSPHTEQTVWIEFLQSHFFPAWFLSLREMLNNRVPWEIVRVWYEGWRACFSKTLFAKREIYLQFHEALLLIAERLVPPT